MKKIFLLVFLMCTMAQLNAQKIIVGHGNATFDGSVQPSSYVEFPDADDDRIKKRWESYLKKFDGKLKSTKTSYFLDNASIKSISPDTLDVHSMVEEFGDVVRVTMGINRNGEFINNSSGSIGEVDKILYDFALQIKKEDMDDEIAKAAKILSGHEREVSDLIEKNEKLDKNNREMRSKIADNERDIKENEQKISDAKRKVENQKSVVQELKDKSKSLE